MSSYYREPFVFDKVVILMLPFIRSEIPDNIRELLEDYWIGIVRQGVSTRTVRQYKEDWLTT
jgi:hypothetical protein